MTKANPYFKRSDTAIVFVFCYITSRPVGDLSGFKKLFQSENTKTRIYTFPDKLQSRKIAGITKDVAFKAQKKGFQNSPGFPTRPIII